METPEVDLSAVMPRSDRMSAEEYDTRVISTFCHDNFTKS